MASEGFYRSAAKAAWVAPLVAVGLNIFAKPDPALESSWHYRMVRGGIACALILTGFIAGIVALSGIGVHRRASIVIPASLGVSINGLVILSFLAVLNLGNKVSSSAAAQQRQQRRQESEVELGKADARLSMMLYGGWVGRGNTPTAFIGLTSLDDQSPAARRLVDGLPAPCSVIVIVAQPAPGRHGMILEPSSLTLKFADGHTVHALDGGAIFSRAKNDPAHAMLKFNAAYQLEPPKERYTAFALIPRGTDMHNVRSVTFKLNGTTTTISGRYLTDVEKREQFPMVD